MCYNIVTLRMQGQGKRVRAERGARERPARRRGDDLHTEGKPNDRQHNDKFGQAHGWGALLRR